MRSLAALAAVLLLAGCDKDVDARWETLRAMEAEMPTEGRVSLCDGYDFDQQATYHGFASRWESIFAIAPPSPQEFELWLADNVCG